MNKSYALKILGGTPTHAARAIGVTTQAVNAWVDPLSATIEDRVCAAYMRKIGFEMPPEPDQTATETAAIAI